MLGIWSSSPVGSCSRCSTCRSNTGVSEHCPPDNLADASYVWGGRFTGWRMACRGGGQRKSPNWCIDTCKGVKRAKGTEKKYWQKQGSWNRWGRVLVLNRLTVACLHQSPSYPPVWGQSLLRAEHQPAWVWPGSTTLSLACVLLTASATRNLTVIHIPLENRSQLQFNVINSNTRQSLFALVIFT